MLHCSATESDCVSGEELLRSDYLGKGQSAFVDEQSL